jgi:hypothetical protein
MTETEIWGTELKLTARVEEDGTLSVEWDHQPGRRYFFHDGWMAILRKGSGETEGMIGLARVRDDDGRPVLELVDHVEPLLT